MKTSTSATSSSYLVCPVCQRKMRSITTQHIKKHGFEDAKSFKRHFGLDSLKCDEMRGRQSKFMSSHNPTAGNGHTPTSIKKMRERRKGKGLGVAGKYERTPEIRLKISKGVTRAWEKGKRGRGWYVYGRKAEKKVWVRSSWEERVVRVLDSHPCVLRYEVEPFQIPYWHNGNPHRYTPDFLVMLEGNIKELWEVKPQELLNLHRNPSKIAALNEFAVDHGINTRVVTLEHIEGMERQVGIQPWTGAGGPWVKPDDPDFRPRSPREQKGLSDDSVE